MKGKQKHKLNKLTKSEPTWKEQVDRLKEFEICQGNIH